jgi:phosphopentomutase
MKRPISPVSNDWYDYVVYLEEENKRLSATADKSMAKMYRACDKQLGKLADLVDEYALNNSVLNDKDDKSFDRLMKIMTESKGVMENLVFLENSLQLRKADTVTSKPRPLVEQRATAKADRGT